MMMKIVFYGSTGIILLLMGIAGYYDASSDPAVISYTKHLGYPPYFIVWLGWCKIAGTLFFLLPNKPRLREWCYAGFSFEIISGLVSHLACHDPLNIVMLPITALLVLAISYFSYRKL
jgi:hypothetical protein